jgi:hypothetical protein
MPAPSVSVWSLLAQGAVDALNSQTFNPAAEASRGWRIDLQRADTVQPSITVVPTLKTVANASRGVKQNTVSLAIMVQRADGTQSGEEDPVERRDEIAGLAQQVEDYLTNPANAIVVDNGVGSEQESWTAVPTGSVQAEVVSEWLADQVFGVMFTVEYTIFRANAS